MRQLPISSPPLKLPLVPLQVLVLAGCPLAKNLTVLLFFATRRLSLGSCNGACGCSHEWGEAAVVVGISVVVSVGLSASGDASRTPSAYGGTGVRIAPEEWLSLTLVATCSISHTCSLSTFSFSSGIGESLELGHPSPRCTIGLRNGCAVSCRHRCCWSFRLKRR